MSLLRSTEQPAEQRIIDAIEQTKSMPPNFSGDVADIWNIDGVLAVSKPTNAVQGFSINTQRWEDKIEASKIIGSITKDDPRLQILQVPKLYYHKNHVAVHEWVGGYSLGSNKREDQYLRGYDSKLRGMKEYLLMLGILHGRGVGLFIDHKPGSIIARANPDTHVRTNIQEKYYNFYVVDASVVKPTDEELIKLPLTKTTGWSAETGQSQYLKAQGDGLRQTLRSFLIPNPPPESRAYDRIIYGLLFPEAIQKMMNTYIGIGSLSMHETWASQFVNELENWSIGAENPSHSSSIETHKQAYNFLKDSEILRKRYAIQLEDVAASLNSNSTDYERSMLIAQCAAFYHEEVFKRQNED